MACTAVNISLPWPVEELRSNYRGHWAPKAKAVSKARASAFYIAKQAGVQHWPNATLFIEYYPPSYRGDVHNVPSSLKAYIDGIADAMGCDDKGFNVDYPNQWAGKKEGGEVLFRVAPPVIVLPVRGQIGG